MRSDAFANPAAVYLFSDRSAPGGGDVHGAFPCSSCSSLQVGSKSLDPLLSWHVGRSLAVPLPSLQLPACAQALGQLYIPRIYCRRTTSAIAYVALNDACGGAQASFAAHCRRNKVRQGSCLIGLLLVRN